MTHFFEKTYEVLRRVLADLGVSDEEQKRRIELFDKVLLGTFIKAVVQKLPPQERDGVTKLANEGVSDPLKAAELKQKLSDWLNQKEVNALFEKTADNLFEDYLREQYQKATAEQKKKLEEMFTPEALGT